MTIFPVNRIGLMIFQVPLLLGLWAYSLFNSLLLYKDSEHNAIKRGKGKENSFLDEEIYVIFPNLSLALHDSIVRKIRRG